MARDKAKRKYKLRQRRLHQGEHRRLKATFEDLHRKGVYIKRLYRLRGIDLPFYDYYDSYFDEFRKVVAEAKEQFPSLLGVFEVEDSEYYGHDRSQFAATMQQILWHSDSEYVGYGTRQDESNINGYTNAFLSEDGQVKTLVVIRKKVPNSKPHRECKYVCKLVSLLHELGHVCDIERQGNFDHDARTCDVIEAEVFAHLHSLQRMADKNYYQCFSMLVDALKGSSTRSDYLGVVAKRTLELMPGHTLIDLNSVPLEPLTSTDLEVLGFAGREALGF